MKFTKKITKELELERVVYLYFLIVVLFSGYVEYFSIWNLLCIICLLALCFLCGGFKSIKKNKSILISLFFLIGIFLLCSVSSIGNMKYFFPNVRSITYPICVILSFYIIQMRKPDLIIGRVTKGIVWFNMWLVINLVILYQQVNQNFIFIKGKWLQTNPYYRDHCSGLFGANSTDILGYYIIFVVLLNIYYANAYEKNNIKRGLIIVYSGIISALSLYLFTKNDGVAHFILLPLALVYQMFLSYDNKRISTKILKAGKYLAVFLVAVVLLTRIQPVRAFVTEKVLYKVETMLKFRTTTAEIRGSNERIAIAAYGLSQGWGWGLGKGIGYLKWQAQNAFGFDHFGISSIGSFINLTGIWFYLMMCFFYTNVWNGIALTCKKVQSKYLNYWMLFANVVLMTIYVYIFTEIRTNICLVLIILVLYNTELKSKTKRQLIE